MRHHRRRAAGLEIRRASDGQPLLLAPAERRAVEVEVDCQTGRVVRRKSIEAMIEGSVGAVLAPLGPR